MARLLVLLCHTAGAAIYRHSWDTVGDVMGMHGKFTSPDALPSPDAIKFAAEHYGMITTGGGCPGKKASLPALVAGEPCPHYNDDCKVCVNMTDGRPVNQSKWGGQPCVFLSAPI